MVSFAAVEHRGTLAVLLEKMTDNEAKAELTLFASVLFHLLRGGSMLAYEDTKELLTVLQTPNVQKLGWSARTGWSIADCMHTVLVKRLAECALQLETLSVSCDESTTDAGESRMSVHLHVVSNYQRKPILAGLPVINEPPNAENLTKLLLCTVMTFSGLTAHQLASKLITIAADGAAVLQGEHTGVITRAFQQVGPCAQPMHCMAHRADLAASTIGENILMQQVVSLLSVTYTFFKVSTVRKQLLKDCQRRVLPSSKVGIYPKRNVVTWWISHTYPAQVLWDMLPALLLYVSKHYEPRCTATIQLHAEMIDMTRLLALAAFRPMLHQLKTLILVLQKTDAYVEVCTSELTLCALTTLSCCQPDYVHI
jgi:hypothetical protein